MAWTAPMTATLNGTLTAANFNTHVRDNLLETEAAKATTPGSYMVGTGANSIAERQFASAYITRTESTASTSYADLATVGPAVYCNTGTSAMVWVAAEMQNSATALTAVSVSVFSNTTLSLTVSASDSWSLLLNGVAAANACRYGQSHLFTGLTAGFNTFTMQYRVASGTGTFARRELVVMPL